MACFIIMVMFFSFLISLGMIYLINDKELDGNTWGASFILGLLLGIINCIWISIVSYEDISAKLLSQNKISSVFEIEYEQFWGLVHGNKTENIQKFIMYQPSRQLKYNDRYFIIMKLAGQDVSKYADINGNEVIYRMTLLQEMEEK